MRLNATRQRGWYDFPPGTSQPWRVVPGLGDVKAENSLQRDAAELASRRDPGDVEAVPAGERRLLLRRLKSFCQVIAMSMKPARLRDAEFVILRAVMAHDSMLELERSLR
ncbi:MAG: hypothetical protein ACRECL_10205 [Bradyrhizobium sp.]